MIPTSQNIIHEVRRGVFLLVLSCTECAPLIVRFDRSDKYFTSHLREALASAKHQDTHRTGSPGEVRKLVKTPNEFARRELFQKSASYLHVKSTPNPTRRSLSVWIWNFKHTDRLNINDLSIFFGSDIFELRDTHRN